MREAYQSSPPLGATFTMYIIPKIPNKQFKHQKNIYGANLSSSSQLELILWQER